MTIIPKLLLDERDMEPFVKAYKKQIKAPEEQQFRIESIVPVAVGDGKFNIEIGLAPVKEQ